ncbi:MAG: flagellar biosynthesis anti-sigma factor FlgM [Pacificimonas sp.]
MNRMDVTKIGSAPAVAPSSTGTANAGTKAAAAAPTASTQTGMRTVELSALAVEALRSDAPIDTNRVEAIRTAIAEGRYPVEPGEIAKAMIRMEYGDDAA